MTRDERNVETAGSWADRHPVSRTVGVIAVLSGCFIFSLNGYVSRQFTEATSWQIVFYRAVFLLPALMLVYVLRHRRATLENLRPALPLAIVAGPLQGLGSSLFIFAITTTTVANVVVMLSTAPLLAALFAAFALGERISRATLAAISVSATGVFIMTLEGFASGSWAGSMAAFANAVTFAVFVVLLRRGQSLDMLPAAIMGAIWAIGIGYTMAADLALPVREVMLCFVWGALIQCAGMSLITYGSRGLRAAEITLLTGIEFILSPTWAWVAVGELPSLMTVVGGGIVFTSVLSWSLLRAR